MAEESQGLNYIKVHPISDDRSTCPPADNGRNENAALERIKKERDITLMFLARPAVKLPDVDVTSGTVQPDSTKEEGRRDINKVKCEEAEDTNEVIKKKKKSKKKNMSTKNAIMPLNPEVCIEDGGKGEDDESTSKNTKLKSTEMRKAEVNQAMQATIQIGHKEVFPLPGILATDDNKKSKKMPGCFAFIASWIEKKREKRKEKRMKKKASARRKRRQGLSVTFCETVVEMPYLIYPAEVEQFLHEESSDVVCSADNLNILF